MDKNKDSIPFNFYDENSKFEGDELRDIISKWLFATTLLYTDLPPDCLVKDVIEQYREREGRELSYEEAKPLVESSQMAQYIVDEVNTKRRYYHETVEGDDAEAMEKILNTPLEQIKAELENIGQTDSISMDSM